MLINLHENSELYRCHIMTVRFLHLQVRKRINLISRRRVIFQIQYFVIVGSNNTKGMKYYSYLLKLTIVIELLRVWQSLRDK